MNENVLEQWLVDGTNVNSLEARTQGGRVASLVHALREERLKHAKRTTQLTLDCEGLLTNNDGLMEEIGQLRERIAAKDVQIDQLSELLDADEASKLKVELADAQSLREAEARKMQALLDNANNEISRQTEIVLDLKDEISAHCRDIADLKAELVKERDRPNEPPPVEPDPKPKKPKGS